MFGLVGSAGGEAGTTGVTDTVPPPSVLANLLPTWATAGPAAFAASAATLGSSHTATMSTKPPFVDTLPDSPRLVPGCRFSCSRIGFRISGVPSSSVNVPRSPWVSM